jgi:hypothetical protein
MAGKTKRVAAALAAVELYLAEERAAASVAPRSRMDQAQPASGPSPWVLAGRMGLMAARLGSISRMRP